MSRRILYLLAALLFFVGGIFGFYFSPTPQPHWPIAVVCFAVGGLLISMSAREKGRKP